MMRRAISILGLTAAMVLAGVASCLSPVQAAPKCAMTDCGGPPAAGLQFQACCCQSPSGPAQDARSETAALKGSPFASPACPAHPAAPAVAAAFRIPFHTLPIPPSSPLYLLHSTFLI